MEQHAHTIRILALDLRSRRFGYAVLEGQKQLLDWGVSTYPSGGKTGAVASSKRIASLFKLFLPSAVVVKKVRRESARNSSGVRPILKSIKREASARSIPVYCIGQKEVREAFRIFRGSTKYEMASILTQIFPELLWKLPPERKSWQSEHHRMTMFDAIALGFTYWQRSGTRVPPPE